MKLELRGVHKYYGKKAALAEVNLTLRAGVYGLLGPNGAGKSTLMNIIAGNLLPDMGQVLFEGKTVLCPSSRGCMTISPGTGFWLTWPN